jgi:hypothetical protein
MPCPQASVADLNRYRPLGALLLAVALAGFVDVGLALLGLLSVILFFLVCSEQRLKYVLIGVALYTPFEATLLNTVPRGAYFIFRFAPYAILGTAFAILWLRRLWEGRRLWYRTPIDVPLVCFLAASAISFLFSQGVPIEAAVIAYQPFLRFVFLVFFLLMFIEFTKVDAKRCLLGMTFVVVAVSSIGLYQAYAGAPATEALTPVGAEFRGKVEGGLSQPVYEGPERIFSTLGRYNTFGIFLGIFLVASVPFWRRYALLRAWLLLLYALSLPCLLLASSRAAWVATMAGTLAVFAYTRSVKLLTVPLVVALVLVIGAVSFPESIQFYSLRELGPTSVSPLSRALETFSSAYVSTRFEYGRLYYLLVFPFDLLDYDIGRLMVGFGPGSVGARSRDAYGLYTLSAVGVPPANQHFIVDVNWAFILGQTGMLGVFLFGWLVMRLHKHARAVRQGASDDFVRTLSTAFMGLVWLMVIGAFFYNVWEIRPISFYFWLLAGLVVKLGRTAAETSAKPSETAGETFADP